MRISDKIHSLKGKIKSSKKSAIKLINVPKNEIYKGVTILKGMKNEIDRRRKNFSTKLFRVTFQLSLGASDWKNFKVQIKKNLQQFENVCKEGLSSRDKGKSKSYLEDIIESIEDLENEIERFDIDNLKPSYIRTVWTNFEKLSKKLSQLSKKRFITDFGEILDSRWTKTHFEYLSTQVLLLEKKMNELVNTEVCKLILEDAESMMKSRNFDKDINRKIFLINLKSRKLLPLIEISTHFDMFEGNRNKAGHLKQILSSANNKYFIKCQKAHEMINDFLDKKLTKKFINSLQGKLEECIICYEGMDLSDTGEVVTLKCKHTFHKYCIERWKAYDNTCPTCRKKM